MPLLRDRFSRAIRWLSPSFADLGTAFLGMAAILLARAIPSSNLREADVALVALGVAVGFVGLWLRRIGNSGAR